MKITFLGTGTSCGVPVIGCQCEVCQSSDQKDHRLRCSILVETDGTRLLVDCGPDFRQQILPQPFRRIDGILITHSHYDHVGGMDDIRPYCQFGEINVYADPIACKGMLQMLPYCFAEHRYPGVPAIGLHEIHAGKAFRLGDIDILPIEVMHGKLPILGYRIGDVAYLTDMTELSPASLPLLQGIRLLIIGALRHTPHLTHQTVEHAIGFSRSLGDIPTYFIHMSHQVGLHAIEEEKLPAGFHYAYDGMVIEV